MRIFCTLSALFVLGLFSAAFADDNATALDNATAVDIVAAVDNATKPKPPVCKPHLFVINKSDNKNVLYYDAVVKNGEFDIAAPISIYWVMNAEKGQRENLTMLEEPQFGITSKEVSKGKEYIVNVKNSELSGKEMRVFFDETGCPAITVSLSGKVAYLDSIYINLTRGLILPTVHWLELTGYAVSDGEKVSERVTPK
jgi:hypothetical protein